MRLAADRACVAAAGGWLAGGREVALACDEGCEGPSDALCEVCEEVAR